MLLLDLTALAQALDSEQAHTSFGKLPLSIEKSEAQFSFPQANRWDGSKVFVAELTKNENIGKNSPGPAYAYDDRIKYANVSVPTPAQLPDRPPCLQEPKQKFSHAARMAEDKPKYDFYENALFLDDPIQADLNRKARTCAPKIGTEPRVSPSLFSSSLEPLRPRMADSAQWSPVPGVNV